MNIGICIVSLCYLFHLFIPYCLYIFFGSKSFCVWNKFYKIYIMRCYLVFYSDAVVGSVIRIRFRIYIWKCALNFCLGFHGKDIAIFSFTYLMSQNFQRSLSLLWYSQHCRLPRLKSIFICVKFEHHTLPYGRLDFR